MGPVTARGFLRKHDTFFSPPMSANKIWGFAQFKTPLAGLPGNMLSFPLGFPTTQFLNHGPKYRFLEHVCGSQPGICGRSQRVSRIARINPGKSAASPIGRLVSSASVPMIGGPTRNPPSATVAMIAMFDAS